jgi:acyl carrier protein
MSRTEVEGKIREILIAQLELDPDSLTTVDAGTPLLGHGIGLDSVDILAVSAGIEEHFDIQIPDDDLTLELFESIGTLADYVVRAHSSRQEGTE